MNGDIAAVGFFFFTSLSARQECRAELILTSKLLPAVIREMLVIDVLLYLRLILIIVSIILNYWHLVLGGCFCHLLQESFNTEHPKQC